MGLNGVRLLRSRGHGVTVATVPAINHREIERRPVGARTGSKRPTIRPTECGHSMCSRPSAARQGSSAGDNRCGSERQTTDEVVMTCNLLNR